jgi:hypothetical protein
LGERLQLKRLFSALASGKLKGHFGQYAEDVLVRKYFPSDTTQGRYLDVGCYHPFRHSNTAFFWLKGWSGVNVDANPITVELFKKSRPQDTNIWAAVVPEESLEMGNSFVELEVPTVSEGTIGISGIGRVRGASLDTMGRPTKLVKVPAKSINQILLENNLRELDFFSLDIEGFDTAIISEFDFDYCEPKMICVEDFSDSFEELIQSDLTRLLQDRDYKLIGRAGLSSIFSRRGETF